MRRRPLLLPLVPVYAAGLALKRRWVEERPGHVRWLREPVISVGSLSAGGAGKTPVVEALARLLLGAGYGVDVLSRGYGRGSQVVEQVDPEGDAARFGDEPLLLARSPGVPVWVGADRYRAGSLAEESPKSMSQGQDRGHPGSKGGRSVHLLDDGMQHRRLGRALDVVLLTAEDVADGLLPAGNLREPLRELRRAGAIVVRAQEEAQVMPAIARYAQAGVPVWLADRRLSVTTSEHRVAAFCGIARPEGFFAMLRAARVELAGTVSFRDHHRYTLADCERLVRVARHAGATGFVTTAKDAVKLEGALQQRLEAVLPLEVARLEVRFQDEAAVLAVVSGLQRGS